MKASIREEKILEEKIKEIRGRQEIIYSVACINSGTKVEGIGWSRGAGLSRAKSIRGAYTGEKCEKNQHDVDGRSRGSVSPITAVHGRRFFLLYKQKWGQWENNALERGEGGKLWRKIKRCEGKRNDFSEIEHLFSKRQTKYFSYQRMKKYIYIYIYTSFEIKFANSSNIFEVIIFY